MVQPDRLLVRRLFRYRASDFAVIDLRAGKDGEVFPAKIPERRAIHGFIKSSFGWNAFSAQGPQEDVPMDSPETLGVVTQEIVVDRRPGDASVPRERANSGHAFELV